MSTRWRACGAKSGLWLALPCTAFAMTMLMRLGGNDIWFHIRMGRWIAAHRAIPTTDPFAHTSDGPLRYTEALAQLAYAGAHELGGVEAIVLLHAVLAGAMGGIVATHTEGKIGSRGLTIGLIGAASHAAMTPKPQLFSYVCFAALLVWVRSAERSDRPLRVLAPLPLLFAAWANLHRAGTLGLAVLVATSVAWALLPSRRRYVPGLAAITGIAFAALLLNSGGSYYLTSSFDVAGRGSFAARLVEWQPASWSGLRDHHLAAIPLALFALAGRFDRSAGRLRLRPVDSELLVMLGTMAVSARSLRLLPFAAIAAAPAASRGIEATLAWLAARAKGQLRPGLLQASALTLGVAVLGWRYTQKVPPAYWGVGVLEGRVPVAMAAFLKANPPPGNMFNAFDLGGYLLYALAPEQPVFIDGRNDTVYDDAFFRQALRAGHSAEAFREVIAGRGIGWAAVPWEGPGDRRFYFLHEDPEWVLVYWDDAGAVLVRRDEASQAYLRRHAYEEVSLHDVHSRVLHLGSSAEDGRLADEIREAAARSPRSLRAAYMVTLLHRQSHDRAAYQRARERLVRLARERGLAVQPP